MRFSSSLTAALLAGTALFTAAPSLASTQERPAQPAPAAPGSQVIQGNIQVCEAARGEHRIRLEAGRRYSISANSDAFDTLLRLYRPGATDPVAEDDDSGGGLNSRINYTAPESGEYIVRVQSFGNNGNGAYQLRVEPAAPLPPLRPAMGGRVERGQWRVIDGQLSASSPADGGKHFEDYGLTLPAGQAALITLESGSFDTVLRIYRADSRGGDTVAENDDNGSNTNSFLYFAPEQPGNYVVRVTTFGDNASGPYRLRIGTQAQGPRPAPQPAESNAPATATPSPTPPRGTN